MCPPRAKPGRLATRKPALYLAAARPRATLAWGAGRARLRAPASPTGPDRLGSEIVVAGGEDVAGGGTEGLVQASCLRGDFEAAATQALEGYGREVLGYLIARLGEERGNEVFSDLLEDFWRGLPGFGWRCSLRSWIYTLARHASARHVRRAGRRRETPFDTSAGVSAVVARIRSETAAHLKTSVKSRLQELRRRLSDDEQTLLMLRVERNLSWRELAVVMAEPGASSSDDELDKAAARLRQRFQTAKKKLRKLAEDEGLLEGRGDEG